MPSLAPECRTGLRDWCAIVDAIAEGKQTILIRRTKPAYNEFVLLPTYSFANEGDFLSKRFREEHHPFVEKSVASRESTENLANCFAKVEKVLTVRSAELEKLRTIQDHYLWSPNHVEEYFRELPGQDAFVWVLRAYKLSRPHRISVPRGPVVYVRLDSPISLVGAAPVLPESTFNSVVEAIESKLSQPPPPPPPEGLESRVQQLEARVRELDSELKKKDEYIKSILGGRRTDSVDEVISALRSASEQNFLYFEWSISRAFKELGFNSYWNGKEEEGKPVDIAPKGRADVEVEASLAGEPYHMIVEATKVGDAVSQATEVSRMAIHTLRPATHRAPATVFRLLVAPRFTPQVEDLCQGFRDRVNLVALPELLRVLEFHRFIGGITQEEFRRLLDMKERGQITLQIITDWEDAVKEERESLALLLEVYSVLFENKEWMTTDTIHFLLKKDKRPGISEKEVEEAIAILKAPVVDAVIEKTEGGRPRYKASMSPQTFHMRIRKLDEMILKQKSNSDLRTAGKMAS